MTAKTRFKSDAMEAIFESAQAMHQAGAITDVELRGYERDCLAPARAGEVRLAAKTTLDPISRKRFGADITESKSDRPRAIRRETRDA